MQIHDQTNLLPRAKLLVVFAALALSLCITYIDQSAIGILLPSVGKDLDCATTIEWAGTSAMIANAAFQVLYGRMSDIFGRKIIMIASLGLLGLGDLLCGFAKTGPQLYAFRAISGLANGGIMAICMMIVSDIVTLEERGKYQGILGSCIGLGNTIGPFLAAAFVKSTSWRYLFYVITVLCVLAGAVILLILPPSSMPEEDLKSKIKKIDCLGIITSSTAIILILIPISGIGSYFSANSPMVISMLTLGSISAVLFIYVEWKVAEVPMIPLRLFTGVPLCAMFIQNILIGIAFYGVLYYMPVYYQTVRQWNAVLSAALIVPMVASQAVASSTAGYYISRTKRYGEVLWLGYVLWTIATGVQCAFSRTTPPYGIALTLICQGVGVGCIFQPTLIAAQAHSRKEDRAVVISTRNFIRSTGGAVGLALSNAIFANILKSNIPNTVPSDVSQQIESSIFGTHDLSGLSDQNREAILNAYMKAAKGPFILWAVSIGLCLILMVLIKDEGLTRKEAKQDEIHLPPGSEESQTVDLANITSEKVPDERKTGVDKEIR